MCVTSFHVNGAYSASIVKDLALVVWNLWGLVYWFAGKVLDVHVYWFLGFVRSVAYISTNLQLVLALK